MRDHIRVVAPVGKPAEIWQIDVMTTITLDKAQHELPDLIARALAGEDIIIETPGAAAVKLSPVPTPPVFDEATARRRGYGSLKGQFEVTDAFFEPLSDDVLAGWDGQANPVKLLLDTHTLLWRGLESPRLPPRVASILADRNTAILISAISGHEIATKFRLGKLAVPMVLAEQRDELVQEKGWYSLDLKIAHGQLAGRLPGVHKDPFDPMLAAQALVEGLPIVTNDPAFTGFGVEVVW